MEYGWWISKKLFDGCDYLSVGVGGEPGIIGGDSETEKEERKKRPRTAFTASQVKCLESEFERNKYLSVAKRSQLARSLKLTETQVSLIRGFSTF